MQLENHRRGIYLCSRCAYCRDMVRARDGTNLVCPSREHTGGFDAYTAKGRIWIARGVLEDKIKIDKALTDVIYSCALCGNCQEHCPVIDPGSWNRFPNNIRLEDHLVKNVDIMKALRADIFESGYSIPDGAMRLGTAIEKTYNVFELPAEERNSWLPKDIALDKKADTIYFAGCLEAYQSAEIARSTVRILDAAGIKFNVLGSEEWCCGNPLFQTGQLSLARKMAEHNVRKFAEAGARRIITSCPGCARCLRQEYPKALGREMDVEVVHTSELLSELINSSKIKLRKTLSRQVTYHDPCELGRHMGIYEPPRSIITNIKGIKFVELPRNRRNTWCCGAGAGLKAVNPELALRIASEKIREAQSIGTEIILSSCPACKSNIADAARSAGSPVQVMDITEIVAQSIVV